MEITSLSQLDITNGVYTYADYLLWKFTERVELLRGKIFPMSAPSPVHQEVSKNLTLALGLFFENQQCAVYAAPFDVRLKRINEYGDEIHTVVQPDLCVVCDPTKIDNKGCLGAPDLVVEILSPGNSKKEIKNKFFLYEEAGVAEYWVVQPEYESVLVYILENGKYQSISQTPIVDDYVNSVRFPDLKVHTSKIFSKKF